MRKNFASLVGGSRHASTNTSMKRKADENFEPEGENPENLETPGEGTQTEFKTTEVEIPEGSQKIEGDIYLTPDGDISIVPASPFEIETMPEPITQLDIEIHSEEEEEGGNAEPSELVTETPKEEPKGEEGMTEEETACMMKSCNEPGCHMSFVKAGQVEDPCWVLFKNGNLFATIAFSKQAQKDSNAKEFFASENFATKVSQAAGALGWHSVLTNLKAELVTPKGYVAVALPVDKVALKKEVRSELFNDAQIAYAAMRGRLRTHAIAAKMYDEAVKANIESPEAFVASVLDDVQGQFISDLFDVTAEVNEMSPVVKKEFKAMIDRTATSIPVVASAPKKDEALLAKLAGNSLPIAPSATPAVSQNRYSGIL